MRVDWGGGLAAVAVPCIYLVTKMLYRRLGFARYNLNLTRVDA